MAAASKAAAGTARDARTLASSFKASADQKMVDATRLFEVGNQAPTEKVTVATSLVVPDYWDSLDPALTGA
jgi:hypothetical protein